MCKQLLVLHSVERCWVSSDILFLPPQFKRMFPCPSGNPINILVPITSDPSFPLLSFPFTRIFSVTSISRGPSFFVKDVTTTSATCSISLSNVKFSLSVIPIGAIHTPESFWTNKQSSYSSKMLVLCISFLSFVWNFSFTLICKEISASVFVMSLRTCLGVFPLRNGTELV